MFINLSSLLDCYLRLQDLPGVLNQRPRTTTLIDPPQKVWTQILSQFHQSSLDHYPLQVYIDIDRQIDRQKGRQTDIKYLSRKINLPQNVWTQILSQFHQSSLDHYPPQVYRDRQTGRREVRQIENNRQQKDQFNTEGMDPDFVPVSSEFLGSLSSSGLYRYIDRQIDRQTG